MPQKQSLQSRIYGLYHGRGRDSRMFRYGLMLFDVATMVFLVVSSFFVGHPVVEALDVVLGLFILAEFTGRMIASKSRWRELTHPVSIADIIAIISLLAPVAGESFAFLRVIRALRLLRTYRVIMSLREDFAIVRRNQDTVNAAAHLLVFLFIMTALVYELQSDRNPLITNYADALYFTVTTLTTTGFGDITLTGQSGRLLAVLIMVFGVSLFLRLIQTLFRPSKVHYSCPSCGLSRHDPDAVHCKHCGTVVNIPTEGEG